MFAALVGAAHTVRARRDVPKRRHSCASMFLLRQQAVIDPP